MAPAALRLRSVVNELIEKLMGMIRGDRTTIITGDFNICYLRIPKNQISKKLCEESFQQLVREPSHIMGGHIDHVYWRNRSYQWEDPDIERFSPYYSDHDGLCVTLMKK